ncbi:hypothetical protein A3E39_00220 [Candidatus Uhrbacteria bacterium RIFCSPHIGHO2_12_FULL_60_25]|uniref:Uncharacterized protein n=1 Tax=Candidatus Uhrbacteria bacterium RIFCSPHIGHO2_12_FULL_60_25 TaxID=1802399 RepID=A0A1F7UKM6_9BACT|nr:MAG: hypothetical protein A3D73_00195 [Candidatus Uhrbacteria bacterium RIFCSPHIGHO2_02_FULL_60_44]OGL78840.1 MAG: hypothetical protein A3E39_00220 [Candidatus Uhrbacteria bacterium RIFCSPHIGHO2_12_FULL_60_25]
MQAQETVSSQETPRKAKAAATKTFDFQEALEALKDGAKKHESLSLLERAAEHLSPEQRRPLVQRLIEQEGCSQAFAERFFDDAKFRKRVTESCRNFSEHGERMVRLEEAEIFTELMQPGSEDIAILLKTTNPQERFKQLEPLDAEDLKRNRLWDLKYQLTRVVNPREDALIREVFKNAFERVGVQYTGTDADWSAVLAKSDLLEHFLSDGPVREVYRKLTNGKKVEGLGRRIQLTWRERSDGRRIPSMHVQQMAVNPETNYVSELGFTIEHEPPQEGEGGESKRVLKDVIVVVDKDARNRNEGAEFLLGNLRLIKAYKLHEAEFTANIKVGSYVWARISDVDVPSMAEKLLPNAKAELGPKPWDEKKARGLVFRDEILPTFEKNLVTAIWSVIESIKDSKEKAAMNNVLIEDFLNTQYDALKRRALAGELSMEELVNLGKGLDVFRFNNEGEIVRPDASDADHYGHLGKAAVMGIPWKARIGLHTRSMFGLVDRLSKGTGFVSFLKKSGQKIGLALSL